MLSVCDQSVGFKLWNAHGDVSPLAFNYFLLDALSRVQGGFLTRRNNGKPELS